MTPPFPTRRSSDLLAQRRDRLACDHLAADRRLDRNLEQMTRDQILEALAHPPAPAFGGRAVEDHAERIDGLGFDEDAHLVEIAVAIADLVIVKAHIATAEPKIARAACRERGW